MEQFSAIVEEPRKGILVLPIPTEIMRKYGLKPFMAVNWETEKNSAKISFSKTVKIRLDLDRKTIKLAKQIMELEGMGSLDEVFNNVILAFLKKEGITKEKTDAISFLYPMDFFKKKYWLIDDYEKRKKLKN